MANIGIMGGTFDPIHIGHLIAAETARDACELDEVWFIPTHGPPLKEHGPRAGAQARWAMVCAAIRDCAAFRANDIELRRGGISYSYDTVTELKRLHPEHSFRYIIGSDRVNDLPKWHAIEELAELVSFVGLERPSERAELGALPAFLRDKVRIVPMPAIGVSSTVIRDRLAAGRSVRFLVPEAVYQLIRGQGWYGTGGND